MEFLLIGTTIGSEPDWSLDENITARPNDLLLHRVWFNHRTRSRPAGRRDSLQDGYSRRHQVDFLLSLATIITFQDFFGLQSLKIDQKLGFTCIGAVCRASIQTTTQLWDPPNRGQIFRPRVPPESAQIPLVHEAQEQCCFFIDPKL